MAKTTSKSLAARPAAAPPRVRGFRFSGVHAGLKNGGALDTALMVSDFPAVVAGVFTQNRVMAAPVKLSRQRLQKARRSRRAVPRAILVNSKNANCATGAAGLDAARVTSAAVAEAMELRPDDVFVASTGVIGEPLPTDKIIAAVPKLVGGLDALNAGLAAEAILTTDTVPKWASHHAAVGNRKYTVGGVAKGVGMISPHMATMLAFVFTDAAAPPGALQDVLRAAVGDSFNAITVEGDMSTNDTVLMLANGAAKTPTLGPGRPGWKTFTETVMEVCYDLAYLLIRDAEGATHVVTVHVQGARSVADADKAARAIAHSPLVKTAIAGNDPNWGRIVMALGHSGARFREDTVSVWFDDVPVMQRGCRPRTYSEAKATVVCRRPTYTIRVHLGAGRAESAVTTCDLTAGYIQINADYRS